jgi:hypothetical protein
VLRAPPGLRRADALLEVEHVAARASALARTVRDEVAPRGGAAMHLLREAGGIAAP